MEETADSGSCANTGFIVRGKWDGKLAGGITGAGHFGPVSIGAPDQRIEKEVAVLGERFCALLNRI